jgi:hypothetical protein
MLKGIKMKIFLKDDELDEIDPLEEINKSDKAIIHNPTVGKRSEGEDELRKEIIGNDAIEIGPTKAAEIHGVSISQASRYSNGMDLKDKDAQIRMLARRNDITDIATLKLMDTLNLINVKPEMKVRDKIAVATGLANIVDKIGGKKEEIKPQVHLHLYGPNEKKETDYNVIDV